MPETFDPFGPDDDSSVDGYIDSADFDPSQPLHLANFYAGPSAAPKKKSSPPPAPRKLVFPSFDRPRRIPRGRGVAADSTDTVRPVRGRIGVIEVGVSRAEADAEIKRMLEHDPRFWREYLWL
jgi:hypothetical protein